MEQQSKLGNFINGSFVSSGTIALTSKNPSRNFEPVYSVKTSLEHVMDAVLAAKSAEKSWAYLSQSKRNEHLIRLKECFKKNEAAIAQAISLEMGKIESEALAEAKSLSARIDLMISTGLSRIKTEELYNLRARTSYHPQGALGVIGPYNFPAHLVNAHVIPSLLTGNTVVVKPSEVCLLTAERYAQCFLEAELPAGVFNMVQGDATIAQALATHPLLDGVLFTGSYKTGRLLQGLLLDQPHKILALEMGGKNFAIVMDDADIKQALLEIIQGAFLTTGQRCTATSRVLVQKRIADAFISELAQITAKLLPTTPEKNGLFGPLATKGACDKFLSGLARAKEEGAQVLVWSRLLEGGAFVTPSLYHVKPNHPVSGYLSEELFGPNIAIESFDNLDQAILRVNESPFGLSNSIFTLDQTNAQRLYNETKCGVLNVNRSTNGAYGQMPFGGVNKSGNQRPAGIDAVRYTTFPVALSALGFGESAAPMSLQKMLQEQALPKTPQSIIVLRHQLEEIFELYGINSDFAGGDRLLFSKESLNHLGIHRDHFFAELGKLFGALLTFSSEYLVFSLDHIAEPQPLLHKLKALLDRYWIECSLSFTRHDALKINIPPHLELPRSRAMLDRLYQGHFVPQEKKTPVADLHRSKGAYLVSVDQNPLILFDAASQIATLGAGFLADAWQNAYDCGELDLAIENTYDLAMENDGSALAEDALKARSELELFLQEKTKNRIQSFAYGAGGAEANEIAFDLCRQNGPGGTRIIAFEGAFHGRTIMALQATYNKEKRGPFAFSGYEATFIPFPNMRELTEPPLNDAILEALRRGEIPHRASEDELLNRELSSLAQLKSEVEKGNICCVIVEPMQCEGGDNYGSKRFFNGLRALTRALKIPLVFDEVQTGFHLGRSFFWYEQFDLKDALGNPEFPDCVTLAKKAQLGICMSVWPNSRSYTPHVLQLKRGLIHARAINGKTALIMEQKAFKEMALLQQYFPQLVKNIRACGFAFAFDMPSNALAMELINQRFDRGFMAYIAGEKTLRFRLNMCSDERTINSLFEKLFVALADMRDGRLPQGGTERSFEVHPSKHAVSDLRFEVLTATNFTNYAADIEALEKSAYEKGRRDSIETLARWIAQKDSLGLVLHATLDGERILAGFAIGGPLSFATSDGPQEDCMRALDNTYYSADITIDERVRGMKLGRMLKEEQIKKVASLKREDGSARYEFISGRNRIGTASAMTHINEALGAYTIKVYDRQYGDEKAQALYYRMPIAKAHRLSAKNKQGALLIDCQNSISHAFERSTERFADAMHQDRMRTLACQKLTLSNWATPNLVRYSELLRSMMPASLTHAYFTSGRDEVVDKGLRSLRFHRPKGEIAIGFSHQWLGTISAAARSLSHDEGQAQPFSFFDWPKVRHPGVVGPEQSLHELKALLNRHPAESILGIVIELLGEKSALTFEDSFLQELAKIRLSTDIPLIFVETTSAFGRNGRSLFLTDCLSVKPNMVWWYTGGQLGHVLVDDRYFVEKPLTLISTWDGDDMSMARAYDRMLAMSETSAHRRLKAFEASLRPYTSSGLGSWHGIKLKDKHTLEACLEKAKALGMLFGRGFDHTLMVCPKPDSSEQNLERIVQVLGSLPIISQ